MNFTCLFFFFQIKSQLKRQAAELGGYESSDVEASAGGGEPAPSTSGTASKIKRQAPLKKSVDTILGEVVADRANDVAVRDRIEALLDGVDAATTSKLAFGHFIATLMPRISDRHFNKFIREVTNHALWYIEISENEERQMQQQQMVQQAPNMQQQALQQAVQQPNQQQQMQQPQLQFPQQQQAGNELGNMGIQPAPILQPIQHLQQPQHLTLQNEGINLAAMQMPPPMTSAPQPQPAQLPSQKQLEENAKKQGFVATLGLSSVRAVITTAASTHAETTVVASGSRQLASLSTVDIASLPPVWDTPGPSTPRAVRMQSPNSDLQSVMENASLSPFVQDDLKSNYSPSDLVDGTHVGQDEEHEVTGEL